MKTISIFSLLLAVCSFGALSVSAQSSIDKAVQEKVSKRTVAGAKMGSLICENASGNLVLCSGKMEETVAGIVTNLPYITLNKPSTPRESKYIFSAIVASDAGQVVKGDVLVPGSRGTLVLGSPGQSNNGYAIALDEVKSGEKSIKVKVIQK